ncbi:MAG: hypothetical protein H8E32_03180 [Nitrospinae bacterium]|nr:hypothetical protein [Nitrospinota bacterium]
MSRITRISTSLIILFLLYFVTIAQAQPTNPQEGEESQNCRDTVKKMISEDFQIKKIQKHMRNAMGGVSGEANELDMQGQGTQTHHPRIDKYNRSVNILILNLGGRVLNLKKLIENAKQQGNNCKEMVTKISNKVDAMQGIHVKILQSLDNQGTSGRELYDLIKNLEQQANGTDLELQSAVQNF